MTTHTIWVDIPGSGEIPVSCDFYAGRDCAILADMHLGGLALSLEQAELMLGPVEWRRFDDAVQAWWQDEGRAEWLTTQRADAQDYRMAAE